ncbi:hypothetical protein PVAP13_3NG181809 [Panicum virgatum]|uniref:Uncharacterized protein n=1 Tax=Panicum virgatum TaxID=38727 RepID=A0A8T0U5I7_PANVG|nr:hypothetical protein PVAP13_3NG181809 [Panicum virgatum]
MTPLRVSGSLSGWQTGRAAAYFYGAACCCPVPGVFNCKRIKKPKKKTFEFRSSWKQVLD